MFARSISLADETLMLTLARSVYRRLVFVKQRRQRESLAVWLID